MNWLQAIYDFLVPRPLLLLGLAALPFLGLARFSVFPSRQLVFLGLIPACSSLLLARSPGFLSAVVAIDGVFVLLLVVDLLFLPRTRWFTANRLVTRVVSQGKPHPVELSIFNRHSRHIRGILCDDLPEEFSTDAPVVNVKFPPQTRTVIQYRFRSSKRGMYEMQGVHLRVPSRLRMWNRTMLIPASSTVHVYPDMKQLGEYELLARTNRLSLLGLRQSRKIGSENEFERLRDYTVDDDHRHIDWRATARRQELTVRDFQANQNQQVVFMIDCGRLMTGSSGSVPMLDHAINSMLMLSYIALSRGDSVGLMLFDKSIRGYLPPRTGTRYINQFLHLSFDQFAEYHESRFDLAFQALNHRVRKRSLVILITNVIDELNAGIMESYLSIQTGRHLPLAVLLRDAELYHPGGLQPAEREFGMAESDPVFEAAIEVAANSIIHWREQAIASLARRGVLTIDAHPDELTAPLVNKYLDIKARGLL